MSQSSKNHDLLNIVNGLPKPEQDILKVLAVLYAPVGMKVLKTVMEKNGCFAASTTRLIDSTLKKTLIDLQVLQDPTAGWCCAAEISEILMRDAVQEPWFEKLAKEELVRDKPYYFSGAVAAKQIRLFLYLGNETEFVNYSAYFHNNSPKLYEHYINRIFFNKFDEKWFAGLADVFQFTPLRYLVNDGFEDLTDISAPYQKLEQFFGAEKPARASVAHTVIGLRLLRGRLQDAEQWLDGDTSAFGLILMATLRFFENRNGDAINLFQAGLKQLKKEQSKRNITIDGLFGVFFALALLRSRTDDNLPILNQHLTIAAKQHGTFYSLYALLAEATSIHQARLRPEQAVHLFRPSTRAYDTLIQMLMLRSLGETERLNKATCDTLLKQLANYCRKAQQLGYGWYAAVSSHLLQRLHHLDKDCRQIAESCADSPFLEVIDLLPLVAPWERALTALTQLNAPAETIAASHELRMIWLLTLDSDGDATLTAKEQRLGKNGQWSKGRAVSLKRLYQSLSHYDYLTDHDRKICRQIRMERNYNYYDKEEYALSLDGLLAAVGHPHVYWLGQEQSGAPVDINTAEPQLLVKEQGEQLHISLMPAITSDNKLIAQKTAGNGVLLYVANDQHCQVAEILGDNGLTVPASARQQVIDSISKVAAMLTVQSDIGGASRHATEVPVESRLHIHVQPIGLGLQIEAFAQPFADGGPLFKPGVGGVTVLAEIDGQQWQTTRDLVTEKNYLERLLLDCPALYRELDCKWLLDDPESALEALLQCQALGEFVVLEWPKGKKITLSPEVGLEQARFSVRKERDWFSVEGELAVDDNQVFDMQRLLRLLANSTGRFLKLEDGQIVALTRELRQRLDDMTGLGDVRDDQIRFHPLAAQALSDITDGMAVTASKPWRDQLKRLNKLNDLDPQPPSTLQGELRDYQREGFQWLTRLAYWGAGACLADDMGLGKTVQALALILSRAPDGPTLILAPTSVCINWLEESQRFAPTLNVQHFGHGDRQAMIDNAEAFDLIVCSYGLLQTEAERLTQKRWHTLVADEAQAIKNALTKRSKAAMALQADFKLVTTGTPIENHLGELWNLFNFINPGLLGSLSQFNERYAQAIENRQDYATQQRLKKLLRPFILRRLKNDVLTELPARTEVTLHVELSAQERTLYEALRRNAMLNISAARDESGNAQLKALAEIMKLRRACCHPRLAVEDSPIPSSKLQAFEELVDELLENRHKALVFSQFVSHLSLIRERLDAKGIRYHYLDGATPVPERKKAMNAFQAGDGDLFLISLKAGGTGLNLTAADYVIHMDPWWNPAVEDQASDRAHRMGQKRPVTIYRLVAKDTIEDKIVDLHRHKRDLANSLLEGGEVSGKMSLEDMMALLAVAE